MTIPVLVVEDEPVLARRLQQQLATLWPGIDLLPVADNGAAAIALALEHLPRVIFLDIHMPAASGLDAAEAIVEDWPEGVPLPQLVFVTAYGQYAVQAFEHGAIDYLLKPVSTERLQRAVQRLQERLALLDGASGEALGGALQRVAQALQPAASAAPLSVINAAVGAVTHLIPIDDVLYFEVADKYLRVVTREREALIRMTLRELLQRLDAERFWQVHRSLVVQARCIAQVERSEDGRLWLGLRDHPTRLGVSRLFAHRFKAM
ncbi:LytTR family DNA-binding domain-containing protein [Piscinibacter gummiphilus]|uniref:LytTR family DNA-binding domain-containing protein n=1 Tax=Piscinibacter gummiphilus TaxID=946333 RepID=A0ABZ0CS47_9BURK|nr:LytTR family DNA-binding domain-containing protein [Piscinibacter gummiphilus]WOB07820.1 LytTR family DNA-binding domain-containing protein [Piscinibacter gummiphilus]